MTIDFESKKCVRSRVHFANKPPGAFNGDLAVTVLNMLSALDIELYMLIFQRLQTSNLFVQPK